ncbi:hypothetical protein BDV98DRAFT_643378 [Pterulicium gracile]|uniref:Uncharacterized protein n=1 Tax=Pterulicium gracile TaxID=1884261 RepID=A0A5C3QRB5_9AGAR|nr:hypothetical protein BDV98DRAFT_643378 [Pterula gracilis]
MSTVPVVDTEDPEMRAYAFLRASDEVDSCSFILATTRHVDAEELATHSRTLSGFLTTTWEVAATRYAHCFHDDSDVDDGAYSCGASSSNTNAIPTKLQVNPFDLSERISNLGYELASSAAHMPTIDRDKICGGFISVPTWACEERPWRNQAFRERGMSRMRSRPRVEPKSGVRAATIAAKAVKNKLWTSLGVGGACIIHCMQERLRLAITPSDPAPSSRPMIAKLGTGRPAPSILRAPSWSLVNLPSLAGAMCSFTIGTYSFQQLLFGTSWGPAFIRVAPTSPREPTGHPRSQSVDLEYGMRIH